MRAPLIALLSATIPAACRGPTAPVYDIEITITDSVIARRSENEVNLVIPVKVKNLDARTLYYDFCGHALFRRGSTEWEPVQLPPCSTSAGYSFALYRGESYQFTFRVRQSLPSTQWPAVGANGEYRMVLWLYAVPRNLGGIPPRPLALASRISPTFSITEVAFVP